MEETIKAYIAGFFDGEGCVHASNWRQGKQAARVRCSITQKSPDILYWIRDQLGFGTVTTKHTQRGTYYWYRAGDSPQTLQFMELVLPYSKVKYVQLLMGIELAKLTKTNRGAGLAPEIKEERLRLARLLKEAKQC